MLLEAAPLVPAPSVLSGKGAAPGAVCSPPDSCSLSLLVPWELAWLDFFFDLLGESFFEAACDVTSNLLHFCRSMIVSCWGAQYVDTFAHVH